MTPLFAVSDQVWLALIQLATLIVGLVSVWMQQRNKNVTVANTKEIKEELAVNTALTQKSANQMEETHRVVQNLKP